MATGFFSNGSPSVKFSEVGDTITAVVDGPIDEKHQTKVSDPSQLDYFPSGDPKLVWILPLATSERLDDDDDGKRSLWINGTMRKVLLAAIKKAGVAREPEVGDQVTVTLTELRPTKFGSKQKIYSAEFTPKAANSFLAEQDPAEVAPAAPQAAPANTDALQAALAAMTDEQKKAAGLA